ncbi:MAG: aminopeptidase P family protein [archaeon]|nr:aminopeptidase P family protein [archaeon]
MNESRAAKLMTNADCVDKIIIMNGREPFLDSVFWYLTEINTGVFEDAKAIVSRDGTVDIVVNSLEEESARTSKCNVHIYKNAKEHESIIKELLGNSKIIGINAPYVAYNSIMRLKEIKEKLEIIDVSKEISQTISVKDKKEIKAIEKACDITSSVASELPLVLYEGISEKEASAEVDIRMKKLGSTGNAFDTIACFGTNSSEPHHVPSSNRLKKGEAALFDFGAKFDMYCSDLTRTIFFNNPDEKLKKAYNIVLRAQEEGIALIRDGAKASDVDSAARKIIDNSEFKGLFIHSFGHGIGMNVHQGIFVSPGSNQILRAGNVISAEPGIYIPGLGGIRIEDTILVTEDSCRRLTNYDHNLTIV